MTGGNLSDLRNELSALADKFGHVVNTKELQSGQDYLPPSGKVVGQSEFANLLQAAADMWLTTGRFADKFEEEFPKLWGLKKCLAVNSGSSANLLAFSSFTSPRLKEKALKKGDFVVTPACGFPTTVAPVIQNGLVPVFIDVELETHNVDVRSVENALSDRTRAVVAAHALGNPFRADQVSELARKNNLWFLEDCCDAFGAKIGGSHVGSFGDIATCSFYPAHHITMGEGGAVLMNNANLYKIALSLRDWGRDCWCPPGKSDTCGIRFDWELGDLPKGYDHKYIYSHIGYNLKTTDFQAAVGLAQLERARGFIEARRKNHAYLTNFLKNLGAEDYLILPKESPGTEASWFGYFVVLREGSNESRRKMITYLEANKVGTRLIFAGNLLKQPAFKNIECKIMGDLPNTNKLMNDGFWVGIWPGLSTDNLEFIGQQIIQGLKAL